MFNQKKFIQSLDISFDKSLKQKAKDVFAPDPQMITDMVTIENEKYSYVNYLYFLRTVTFLTSAIISSFIATIGVSIVLSHVGMFNSDASLFIKIIGSVVFFSSLTFGIACIVKYFIMDHNLFLKDTEIEAFQLYSNAKKAPKGRILTFINNARALKFYLYSFHPFKLYSDALGIKIEDIIASNIIGSIKDSIIAFSTISIQRQFFHCMYTLQKDIIVTTTLRVLIYMFLGVMFLLHTVNCFLNVPINYIFPWAIIGLLLAGHCFMHRQTNKKNAKKETFKRLSISIKDKALIEIRIAAKAIVAQEILQENIRIEKKKKKKRRKKKR